MDLKSKNDLRIKHDMKVYGVDEEAAKTFEELLQLGNQNCQEGYELYYQLDKHIWENQQPTDILDDAAGGFYGGNFGAEIEKRYRRDRINPYKEYPGYMF